MADARALRDLAQEVERLSKEGDFDVECRILTTLYPQVEVMHGIALWTEGALGGTRIRVDSYTRSIDADAVENAICNPGTIRVENMITGEIVWERTVQ